MRETLSDEDLEKLKRRNRLKRLAPKTHKVVHESGRSTKNIPRIIANRVNGLIKK